MRIAKRRIPQRFQPALSSLEERCTPTVTSVSFFGVTPAPNTGAGSAQFNGLVVDSQANPVANANLAAFYQVLDLQGNLLAGGPLPLSQAGGASNAESFSLTIPAGSFMPSSQGELIRVVAIDNASLLISASPLATQNSPPQNLVFGEADWNGNTIVGNGTATVNNTTLSDGGTAISGQGTINAVGRNRNGTVLFNSSGNGMYAIANHPDGSFGLALNGRATANANISPITANAQVNGQVNVTVDPVGHPSVYVAGAIKFALHTPVGTVTGSSQNASVSVVTNAQGHVSVHETGSIKFGFS